MTTAQDDYDSGKVENSLKRRALGYRYTETTYEPTKAVDPKTGKPKYLATKKVRKHVIPDTGAITFFLKNRKPERWSDKKEIEGAVTLLAPKPIKKDLPKD